MLVQSNQPPPRIFGDHAREALLFGCAADEKRISSGILKKNTLVLFDGKGSAFGINAYSENTLLNGNANYVLKCAEENNNSNSNSNTSDNEEQANTEQNRAPTGPAAQDSSHTDEKPSFFADSGPYIIHNDIPWEDVLQDIANPQKTGEKQLLALP